MIEFIRGVHKSFPDWKVIIDRIVADDDTAAVHWSGTVTHRGDFHGIAPTYRSVRVSGINLYDVRNGLIESEWEQMDTVGLLAQLGATIES